MAETLLRVENLTRIFPIKKGVFQRSQSNLRAVDGIDFHIARGESLGLVGESGCGKSTTGRIMVKLDEATGGHVYFSDNGEMIDIASLEKKQDLKSFRAKVQMIFQDPYESMNPRRTVFDTVSEPLAVQQIGSLKDRENMVSEILERVGLTPASAFIFRFPHELSGGQRQRVAIARALILKPSFVVADEPTSMLDVSIRISIMDLMLHLADDLEVSYLYITHDLAVARYMCDRIAVMYCGKIVEIGNTEDILSNPQHPYTQALLSAVPVPDPSYQKPSVNIKGGITKAIDPPPECRFLPRCTSAISVCEDEPHPGFTEMGPRHQVACHLVSKGQSVTLNPETSQK